MKKWLNKKTIYLVAVIIIILGIIATVVWRTNFSLEYKEHITISVNLDKVYDEKEVKDLIKGVLGNKKILFRKIETFNDAFLVDVEEISDEEVASLEKALKEKYEITDETSILETTKVGHVRFRDIVKPYIIPTIIATLIIFAYVAIRYLNLGIFNIVFTLLIRLIVSEGVLFSIYEIARIPVGGYFVMLVMAVYITVITLTVIEYENNLAKKNEKNKNSKK